MSSNLSFLLTYAKRYPLWIVLTVVLGLSGAIFNGVSTTLIVPIILTVLGQQVQIPANAPLVKALIAPFNAVPEEYRLLVMGGAVILAIGLKNLTTYLSGLVSGALSRRLTFDLRREGLKLLLEVDLDFYAQSRVGDLLNRLSGEIGRTSSAISILIQMFTVSVTIFIYAIILVSISWQLTLASAFLIGIVVISNQFFIRRSKKLGTEVTEITRAYSIATLETLNGIRLVKAVANESQEYERLVALIRERERVSFKNQVNESAIAPINEFVSIIVLLLIVLLGRVYFGDTIENLSTVILTYLFILFRSLPLLSNLNGTRSRFANSYAGVELARDFLNRQNKPIMKSGAVRFEGLKQGIHFNQISFAYPNHDTLVLKDIDIYVPRGTTLALVGGSGAGKSTLADLLPRFYDPTAGEIKLDGKNLKEFDLKSLRKAMGIVSQDTFLFNASVLDNIAYAKPDATQEEVITAAKRANAYEFIEQLPAGFNTKIGDRGLLLSGGQRQRISIARALLQNPEILILDEATSALDTISERLVQQAIDELSRNRTTIVIAHRLSTIHKADQIAVLERGRLIELGSHDELLASGGQYARLYSLQFADEAERDRAIIRSSYEVRTRLNPMIGFLQLLADDLIEDPEEQQELLSESYHSATRILESIEFIEESVKLRFKETE
ncbi:MAG: ABC transporter ATP-binding protein [Lyngbya sp.]|nr:ABC transporter ATP-binding protein [Lyngbya sp.]